MMKHMARGLWLSFFGTPSTPVMQQDTQRLIVRCLIVGVAVKILLRLRILVITSSISSMQALMASSNEASITQSLSSSSSSSPSFFLFGFYISDDAYSGWERAMDQIVVPLYAVLIVLYLTAVAFRKDWYPAWKRLRAKTLDGSTSESSSSSNSTRPLSKSVSSLSSSSSFSSSSSSSLFTDNTKGPPESELEIENQPLESPVQISEDHPHNASPLREQLQQDEQQVLQPHSRIQSQSLNAPLLLSSHPKAKATNKAKAKPNAATVTVLSKSSPITLTPPQSASPVNLTGVFQLISNDNFDGFLAAQGVPWALRTAANRARPIHRITHVNEQLTIKIEGIIESETTYIIHGPAMETNVRGRVFIDTVSYLDPPLRGVQVHKRAVQEPYDVLVQRELSRDGRTIHMTSSAIFRDNHHSHNGQDDSNSNHHRRRSSSSRSAVVCRQVFQRVQ